MILAAGIVAIAAQHLVCKWEPVVIFCANTWKLGSLGATTCGRTMVTWSFEDWLVNTASL